MTNIYYKIIAQSRLNGQVSFTCTLSMARTRRKERTTQPDDGRDNLKCFRLKISIISKQPPLSLNDYREISSKYVSSVWLFQRQILPFDPTFD